MATSPTGRTGPKGVPAVGGAMDLVHGAKRVAVITDHVTKDGKPKLVEALHLAADRRRLRHAGLYQPRRHRHRGRPLRPARETAGACRIDELQAMTGAELQVDGRRRRPRRAGALDMTEVFICDYIRTPIGRFGGALSSVRADDLGAIPLRALMATNAGVDWEAVDDVIFGCANQAGEDNRNVARMSLLLAGLPVGVSGHDDQPALRLGHGCGHRRRPRDQGGRGRPDHRRWRREHVARALRLPKAESAFSRNAEIYDTTIGWRFVNPLMKEQYGVDSMPETGENVAEDFSISRERPGCLCAAQPGRGGRRAGERPAGDGNHAGHHSAAKGRPGRRRQGRASARRHDAGSAGETGNALSRRRRHGDGRQCFRRQ